MTNTAKMNRTGEHTCITVDGVAVAHFNSVTAYDFAVITRYSEGGWYLSLKTNSRQAAEAKVRKVQSKLAGQPNLEVLIASL